MPRKSRKDLETCFFHIIVQGINKLYVFDKKEDVEKYIYLVKKYSNLHNLAIISYCIMNNHAHFLIYTESVTNMSKAMQKANTVYAKYYNKKENRTGYLFRNRYVSQPIFNESHLFRCMTYIHKNPIKAKIVDRIENYKYSSYNDYRNKKGIINNEVLQLVFGTSKDYLETFIEIHKMEDIGDVDEILDDYSYCDEVINKYKNIYNIENLSYKDETLKELTIELKTKCKLSLREIATKLGKNKDLLSRMLRK